MKPVVIGEYFRYWRFLSLDSSEKNPLLSKRMQSSFFFAITQLGKRLRISV